jgi:hypothetical protein
MADWADAAKIAFGLMVSAFVLSLMVYYFYIGRNVNNEISKQEATKTLMKEYREYSGYNNKVVYAQDVVSLVLEKRGTLAIRVVNGSTLLSYWADDDAVIAVKGATTPWSLNTSKKHSDYTATDVQALLDVNKVYYGEVSYGYSGEVVGVTFHRGTLNASGDFVEG